MDRVRRAILKNGVVGGVLASLPTGPVSADTDAGTVPGDTGVAVESLLPADRAVSPDPDVITEPVDGNLGEPAVETGEVRADEEGSIELTLGGELDGAGQFGLVGTPYVEATWIAPEQGEYVVTANYDVRGHAEQEAEAILEQGGASVASFVESNLAVLAPDDRVVTQRTSTDHWAANEDYLPELVEEALSWAVNILFSPSSGLLRRLIGSNLIETVIDLFLDVGGRASKSIAEDEELEATFFAEQGQTYRIRFTTDGGFSGKSIRTGSGFDATLAVATDLADFTVEPSGTGPDQSENVLTVRKDDTDEGFGAFMLSTTGDIWHEDESEAVIDGSTAVDFVGPERGEDTLRFGGDVENFLLKGPANVYLNGEQVDPDRLGSAEALTNTLRVESAGTKTGFFAVTVSGTIVHDERGNAEAYIRESSALDWIGERRGVDRFRFSGQIVEFVLKGDANVYVNGEQVDPGELGV